MINAKYINSNPANIKAIAKIFFCSLLFERKNIPTIPISIKMSK